MDLTSLLRPQGPGCLWSWPATGSIPVPIWMNTYLYFSRYVHKEVHK